MDYHELKKLGQEIDAAFTKSHPDFAHIRQLIGRFTSHMQSEQATLVDHGRRIGELEDQSKVHDEALYGDRKKPEDNPGLVHTMHEVKSLLKTIKHIGIAIFIALSVAGTKWLLEFIIEVSKKL